MTSARPRRLRAARLIALLVVAACSRPAEAPPDASADVRPETAACRPVDEPHDPSLGPPRLPCARTVEPCNGVDDDQDGLTDPKCPTQACASDSDCTFGALMPDADCCTRFCGPGSCGRPDGCGGKCECSGTAQNATCNSIDGVGLTASPFACWGVLCPPGEKCVEGQCRPPGTRRPGETCASGLDCPINAGCIPSPNVPDSARCLTFCHARPCPEGFYCSEYHQPGPVGGEVTHETCQLLGVCATGADRCAREYTACLGDAACQLVLDCAARTCGPPEGERGGESGGACMAGCAAAGAQSTAVTAYRACLAQHCAK